MGESIDLTPYHTHSGAPGDGVKIPFRNLTNVPESIPTLQQVFDIGQDIVIADTDNQTFSLTNNDTTNNPNTFDIVTTATGDCMTITQTGVLATGKTTLLIESNVAQVNSTTHLLKVVQDHAFSTSDTVLISNDGNAHALELVQGGVLRAGRNALNIYSNAIQVNSPLVQITQDHASSVSVAVDVINDGTAAGVSVTKRNSGDNILLQNIANSASDAVGISFGISNSGAGENFAFKFNGDERELSGIVAITKAGKIRVLEGPSVRYIQLYST